MLQNNIIIQITVIFIRARSNCKSNMAIGFCIHIYTAPPYIRYTSSLQQTRYDY
jgi:hypothetical protein